MQNAKRDSGFTLLEVMVAITVLGLLLGLSVGGWSRWSRAREQYGTAQELRAAMRLTQVRAVTEGVSMCVTFGTTSYTVWRGTCSSADKVQGPTPTNGAARLATPAFTPLTAAQSASTLVFTPRGTASQGNVHISRPNTTKDYWVKVDGFTARVSLCDESGCSRG